MRLIYVAGPYRAATIFGVMEHIEAARREALRILAAGHYPVVPHLNTGLMDGVAPDWQILAGARMLMRRCDEVLLLPGWELSEGTCLEVEDAIAHHMPVYDTTGTEISDDLYRRVRQARAAAEESAA